MARDARREREREQAETAEREETLMADMHRELPRGRQVRRELDALPLAAWDAQLHGAHG